MTDHAHKQPGTPRISSSSEIAEAMQKAAVRFLDSLTPALREKAHFAFDSPGRRRWHYVPQEMFDRKGAGL